MPEQLHQPFHDRKPHAEPLGTHAMAVPDLVELVEDPRQVIGLDTDAGVPDLEMKVRLRRAGDHDDAAVLGVLQGVLHQVAHHALDQLRVAADRLAAG